MTTTATGTLGQKVLEYTRVMRELVPTVRSASDWSPLTAFVAVDDFRRTGCFLEVQDWQQYTEMMAGWAAATETFETTVHRIVEVDRLVYFQIEERHHRPGGAVEVVNSMTVFEFDDQDKIRRIQVYLQRKP